MHKSLNVCLIGIKIEDNVFYSLSISRNFVYLDLTLFDTDIFVNCNWVATRWQKYSTHSHTNNTENNTINNFGCKASGIRTQCGQTKINDEPTT
jgi:hypothetical protein